MSKRQTTQIQGHSPKYPISILQKCQSHGNQGKTEKQPQTRGASGDRLNATFSAACNAVRTRWEVILVHLTPASNEVLRNQGVTYKDTEASLNGFSLSV